MKKNEQERLFKIGRRRKGFAAILREKLFPAVAVAAVICIFTGLVMHDIMIAIYQEMQMSHFYMVVNSATQNMNSVEYSSDPELRSERYQNTLKLMFYCASQDGDTRNVYKLYKNDAEILRTERRGFAVVRYGTDPLHETYEAICYADLSCFDEAYKRLQKYKSGTGLIVKDTYVLETESIYADVEKGIFVPGEMRIDHYVYKGNGQSSLPETVEEFDLTPADTTGLTKYRRGQFTCGNVFGIPADDDLFAKLDMIDKGEADKNGLISLGISNSIMQEDKHNKVFCWFRSNIYAPDGELYTVTAVYTDDITRTYTVIMAIFCAVVLLICVIISLIRAFHANTIYKAHYAMEDYRRDMTNTLAHDLKTPLMAVSGCAEMLRDSAASEKQKKYTDMILSNVEHMNSMIENVLELAKLENGTVLHKESVDLASCISDILNHYAALAEEKRITVNVHGTGTVNADKRLMTQALDNLISNALKFSPDGGRADVEITDSSITVSNSFDGSIDAEPDTLWQPFVKGSASRNGDGSGLGMYIVKNICDMHGFGCSAEIKDRRFRTQIDFSKTK